MKKPLRWAVPGLVALAMTACIKREPGARGADDADAGPAVPATVRLEPKTRFQTLEGFGASVGWHLDRITGETPEGLYELLFPELGLDILRFRNRYGRSKRDDAYLQHEVEILARATKALGRAPRLLMSSWSPPASLKATRKEDCTGNSDCTLAREGGSFVYEKFAQYWYDSLVHYDSLGIRPEWVSIQNEPSFSPPSWEGCQFAPSETSEHPGYDRALKVTVEKLRTLPNPPKILGPEVLGIHWNRPQNFMATLDPALLDGMAHHLYERGNDTMWDWRSPGPDSFIDEMQAVRALTDKPIFMTEFNTDEDRGTDGGFETAWLVHNSLVEESVVAWLYWDLIWTGRKGLVGMSGKKPLVRDHYYALKHYARYTDPGDVRVEATSSTRDVRATAFLSPESDRLTVVLLNTGKKARSVSLDRGGFRAPGATVFRTRFRPPRPAEAWKEVPVAEGALEVSLPPRSVATVVLGRAS